MRMIAPAMLALAGAIMVARAQNMTDAEALALVHKHCAGCHAEKPTHPAFDKPPNDIALETLAQLKQHARIGYQQTVQNRAMPPGNKTGMTEAERSAFGRWLRAQP